MIRDTAQVSQLLLAGIVARCVHLTNKENLVENIVIVTTMIMSVSGLGKELYSHRRVVQGYFRLA